MELNLVNPSDRGESPRQTQRAPNIVGDLVTASAPRDFGRTIQVSSNMGGGGGEEGADIEERLTKAFSSSSSSSSSSPESNGRSDDEPQKTSENFLWQQQSSFKRPRDGDDNGEYLSSSEKGTGHDYSSLPLQKEPKLEEKQSPPPSSSSFLVRLIFYAVLIFGGLLFYAVLSVSINHGVSLPIALLHLCGLATLPQQSSRQPLYPIHGTIHQTESTPFISDALYVRPLVASLEPSFRHYLLSTSMYPCLCMHHLQIPGDERYRLCAIGNRDAGQVYLMANPEIIGQGEDTARYTEQSISCKDSKYRVRHQTVFIQWQDPRTFEKRYAQFHGDGAVCIQMAIEELDGDKHCSNN